MVVGTTSGAGKSTLVTALCRALARTGLEVAPFKAQNMSNHGAVTPDGGEIGRAQAMQALAARVETDRRMGPVLLKPSGARTSHLVVLGEEVGVADAVGYGERAARLRPVVLAALQSLRAEHEVTVLEGAGGAAEINLLDRDLVNLPLAAAAGVPAVLVVDIERGGAFAAAYGTWALLPERLRACLRGVVINSFRGDVSLLEPGLRDLEKRTGIPVLGVLPHLGEHLMLGVEDSLDLTAAPPSAPRSGPTGRPVRVGVVRLPHLANPSDLDPLVLEPGVELRWASAPGDLTDVDLVVLPGSRSTVADLGWLRERGLDRALADLRRDADGPFVLGICAGYQMLGHTIHDQIESEAGTVTGLGLLPVRTVFTSPKTVRRAHGVVDNRPGTPVAGYEIRWGRPEAVHGEDGEPWLRLTDEDDENDGRAEGRISSDGRVRGTSLHGVLDADALRHGLLRAVAAARGRTFSPAAQPYAQALDTHVDHLADWVEEHLDLPTLLDLARCATRVEDAPGW
ncbi:cobyric acid synthase [Ornithinimicrobium pratense]|uniref:Cobyric acid synthase n=1 Tax=Ornithinimicrobium pratense TaxID=2593973 RepID=A0A5J6V8Z1_9MICO|nr:cobyric acid synthase [Ornithinimicrobium pratense]QFG69937.1 cobyric acid synthase [Ornithinimicrobium pratense]